MTGPHPTLAAALAPFAPKTSAVRVPDGMICPMPQPAILGFSAADFTDDSYLWRSGDEIIISLIIAKRPGTGAFSKLVRTIEANGFHVAVPTPLGRMEEILKRWGFKPGYENDQKMGRVEVWRRPRP